ncbi:MAG: tetratricopeptide repeat protein [Cyanobacteria bacterium SBLK]|nr:tetratricopeptide repeat protein [Cyanobacteria bacterium SBLK]
MLTKLWQWLKRWWSRWFGGETPQKREIAPSPPPKDIEAVFWGLLAEVKAGNTRGWVKGSITMSGVSDGELTIWLRQYAGGLTEAGISSELVEGLRLLGQLDIGAVSREALGIIREWEEKYKPAPLVPKSPQTPSVTVADRPDESQTSPTVEAPQDIHPDAEALFNQGVDLYYAGDIRGAWSCFERAIEIQPNYHIAYNGRGATLYNMGRYEEAIADYNRALEIQPNDHLPYNGRGNALRNMGRYEEAIADYNRALEIQPNDHLPYNGRGNALSDMGRYEEAIADYNRALEIQPNFHLAYHGRGNALRNMGRYEEAIADYNRALEIQPNFHIAYHGRGIALSDMGRYEEAIADYNRALEIQPNFHIAYHGRGNALSDMGRYEEAIADYNRALEIQPNFHLAYHGRGTTLYDMGRYEEAIADYNRALEIQPNYHIAYYGRGTTLYDMGRYEEAIADYNRALEIQPNYHIAYNSRGIALKNMGRYEEAIADYNRAIALKIDFWMPYANRGWAIFNTRRYEAAIISWDEGLSHLDPEKEILGCATVHQFKGQAHYQHGKLQSISSPFFRQAVTSYHIALNLLPNDLKFLETTLAIIQDLILTYRALREPENAEKWELKAIAQLDRLLKETPSPAKKLLLASKFNSFYQLKCDRLALSDNPADHGLALAEAEKWKNLSLQWLREGWIDPPKTPDNRPSLPFPNDATALLYWHLSPCTLTLFLLLPHRPDPVIFTHAIDPLGKTASAENFSEWLKDWKTAYDKSRKPSSLPLTKGDGRGISEGDSKWDNELLPRLQTLRQHLQIAKILPYLQDNTHPIENLILIPHRDLHLLPLHFFFANIPESPFTCVYLPSLQIARDLIERKIKQPHQISPLSIEHPESETPLLFAEMASAFIAHLYDIPADFRLTHNNATKKNIRQQLSRSANSLIFIGHGNYNPDRPLKSALYCAGDEPLTWQELFVTSPNIALPSYFLVCLAACETGMTGTSNFIDECVGFPSGFLSRNTAYILSTLWIVSEDSTGIFMIEFFRALKDEKSPSQSLKYAQNWLQTATHSDLEQWYRDRAEEIEQSNPKQYQNFKSSRSNYQAKAKTNPDFCPYENPYFWAGFVLTGLP